MMMLDVFKKASALLTKKDRKTVFGVFLTMLVTAFMDVIGVASIFPFMAVLANPEVIEKNHVLSFIYHAGNFSSDHYFLMFLGSVVLLILVFGNLFSAFSMWLILKFANIQEHNLSSRLLAKYLRMPYAFFVKKNPNLLVKNIFSEVFQVAGNIFVVGIQMLAKLIIVVFISVFLFIFNPMLAVILLFSLGGAYLGITLSLKKQVDAKAKVRFDSHEKRFKLACEAINAVQDVKIMGLEEFVVKQYEKPSRDSALSCAVTTIIGELPKYFVEVFAFSAILLYLLFLLGQKQNFSQVVPILAMYAYAGMRLMPALHFVYYSYTKIRFGMPSLNIIYSDLIDAEGYNESKTDLANEKISVKNKVELMNISYAYPDESELTLNDISITIPAGSSLGVVGETGAGKTTLVNLMLGLLSPLKGEIKVDGAAINSKNILAWQKNIAYVPQYIYLTDDSITNNIAFGVPADKVDQNVVEEAARNACLHDFILTLPGGYKTEVGDRGVRLSGGQRQRIGIARALYRNTNVLVLDEATSALDNSTESEVLDNIFGLMPKKTMIMIAHRLSTVEKCSSICVLTSGGKVVGQGSYSELLKTCEVFKHLVEMGKRK